ncbi:MAG: hypothetical protein ACRC6M_03295 [Microcystaceae cyanobacterium]
MQNLTSIPIISEINDLPEILEDGPNGAFVTEKVNQLVQKSFRPFNTLDDNSAPIERYIDTVNGLDTNTGLTPESPVKTIGKVLEIFKTGMISWNWNTFIYVKGQLVAPIDLRGVYATSSDWCNEGTLTITNWPSESVPFVIKDAPNPHRYESLQVFITDGDYVVINLEHCTLLIEKAMVFVDNTIYFSQSTVFPVSDNFSTALMFGKGNYYLTGLTIDYSLVPNFRMTFGGFGCFALLRNYWNLVNTTIPTPIIRVTGGAEVLAAFSFDPNIPVKTISVDTRGKLRCDGQNNLLIETDSTSDFGWNDQAKDNYCNTLTFPTLPDGRYMVWIPPKRCRLLKWKLSASSGSATIQMDVGVGFPWGDPITQTFANWEIITRDMNFDTPWESAFSLGLIISGTTAPLTNVFFELIWRDW